MSHARGERLVECEGGHYKIIGDADIANDAVIGAGTEVRDMVTIRPGAIVGAGCLLDKLVEVSGQVGAGTRLWQGARVFERATVGMGCVVASGVAIENGATVGDHCKIQSGTTIYGGVTLEDYVFVGPNATFTNDHNPRAFGEWDLASTVVEIGASIGANATLVAPVRVGSLSLVGAGAVVTKDVLPNRLIVGNPGYVAGIVDVNGNVVVRVDERHEPNYMRRILTSQMSHLSVDPRASIGAAIKRGVSHGA